MKTAGHRKSARANKWWISLLGIVLGGALLIGVPIVVSVVAGRQALRDQMEPLRAAGEPLTFEEWIARLKPIADDENSALLIQRLKKRLDAIGDTYRDSELLPIIGDARLPQPSEPWPADVLAAIDEFLSAQQDVLEELAPIEHMPRGRFSYDLTAAPTEIMLPDLPHGRKAAQIESLAAIRDASTGKMSESYARLRIVLNIAGITDEDPSLIAALVSTAVDERAITTLEQVLAFGDWTPAQLQAMQSHCEKRLETDVLSNGLRAERLGHIAILQHAKQHDVRHAMDDTGAIVPLGSAWKMARFFDQNLAKMLELMAPLIDSLDAPSDTIAAAKAMESRLPLSEEYFLVNRFMPSLAKACELLTMRFAALRSAQAGLAAERFRLDHGQWPEQLSELVPRYLDAVPIDPFDGQPLRYKTTTDGITIYSIAEDSVDNGGDVVLPEGDRRLDIGFRLLNPELRGLHIAETAAPE